MTFAIHATAIALMFTAAGGETSAFKPAELRIERVTTAVPFPRGMAIVDGRMYVLSRGRVRDAGGVTAAINDQAGTIFIIDPEVGQDASEPVVSEAVRSNGQVFAIPTEPPFRLWRRDSNPPERDRETDRPYCTLRYHEPTRSFYLCAFSGIDLTEEPGRPSFSKNCSDAMLRYDLRTRRWHEVDRHHLHAGGNYPHHDPATNPPPHGWMNGPDNCLAIGSFLYAVAKDNSLLVRYNLSALTADPEAGYPPSEVAFNEHIHVEGEGMREFHGQSALAACDGWLYVGYRTSSVILRVRMDDDGSLRTPINAQLVARFDAYDPKTRNSANITDMCFDSKGCLYVVSANGGLVHRFSPDAKRMYDGRTGATPPWLNLGRELGKPRIKCENVLIDERDRLFITSGDGYGYQAGADGTVYRVKGLWTEPDR